uniref:Uncharacterized protein n=1 Tax=Arundo donax TaxID=35708 RepID=A0A0A9G1J4_ARUDO
MKEWVREEAAQRKDLEKRKPEGVENSESKWYEHPSKVEGGMMMELDEWNEKSSAEKKMVIVMAMVATMAAVIVATEVMAVMTAVATMIVTVEVMRVVVVVVAVPSG